MIREDFFEKLDDFDFDSFGKDDNFDNSDVYQVVQFFANKIYNDFESRTCDNCAYRGDTEAECTLLIYILETSLFDTSSTFACNKWLQK